MRPSKARSVPGAGLLSLSRRTWAALAVLIAVHVWAAIGTEFSPARFARLANSIELLTRWWPPAWELADRILEASVVTIQIALMGTTLAVLFALPLSFLAARNTAPGRFAYNASRTLLTVLRGIPEIVIALVLVPTVGLGPFPGVLALFIHNLGVLGKMVSELIEAADRGPQEAVLATGGGRGHMILFGILPQIVPETLSQAFYRLEVNVRASLVLGFIGAGGLGHELFLSFRVMRYAEVLVQVAAILVLITAVDYASAWVRRKVM
ncbi:MAG: phosphonate ABC transporter, permease protein PhnE [Firmicutes bacterium]|nr:phosphonate ABC transporter, permease protein PhnE [Bacillota bacterium]